MPWKKNMEGIKKMAELSKSQIKNGKLGAQEGKPGQAMQAVFSLQLHQEVSGPYNPQRSCQDTQSFGGAELVISILKSLWSLCELVCYATKEPNGLLHFPSK